MFQKILGMLAILCLSHPVKAEWHEASSNHFVIYADDEEEDIRKFTENLERYHSALEFYTGRTLETPSPSNRITVYVVGSENKVQSLAGTAGVAGFYIPRASNSVAFVQTIRNKDGYPDVSTNVLLHEYAHHFLLATNRFAAPPWMSEGAAEFLAASYFHDDGSVYVGLSARHRQIEIFHALDDAIRLKELLNFDGSAQDARTKHKAFYGRSWLLYHYLSTAEDRNGQLKDYWLEVLNGTPSGEAAEKVFGSIGVLERQVENHRHNGMGSGIKIDAENVKPGEVALRSLSEGEAAMMDVRIRSARGTNTKDAAQLVVRARQIAADFPDDAHVLTTLSKTEYVAGNDDAAIAAAERAIELDPAIASAYVQQGLALFRKARNITDADSMISAYARAMEPFNTLNTMEPNHTLPLIYAYRSYLERSTLAPPEAQKGLRHAASLTPFDHDLWLVVGMDYLNEGRIADARNALMPLASNPHGNEKTGKAQSMLAFLATKKEGDAVPVAAAISAYFKEE